MATGVPTVEMAETPLTIEVPEDGLRQIRRWAWVIATGSFLFGYDTGVISGALLFIKEDLHLSDFQQGSVVSVLLLGAIAGALSVGRISDRLGRKRTLTLVGLTFAVGIAIAALAQSYGVMLLGRVIMGLGVGGVSALVPAYISELSPAQIRGETLTLNQLLITLGILVAYLVDWAFAGAQDWRAMFAVGLIPSLALVLGSLRLPETPAWLMHHGMEKEMRTLVSSVASDEAADVVVELHKREDEQRRRAVAEGERKGWAALTSPRLHAAMVVGVTLAVLQQFAGINTVIYYAPTIMQDTGLSATNAIVYSVFIGIINFSMTIVALRLIDRVGRRPLLLVSLLGMLVSLVVLGFSFVGDWNSVIILLFLLLYIVAFAVGMGPVFWVLLGEIFPSKNRASGVSAGSTANWTANFAVSLAFLPLLNAIGTGETFWLFGVVCAFGIWFVGRYVPETKDHEFPEVDAELQARSKGEVPPPALGGRTT
jgi:SP family galactose:H+ symporter-like MFS transporter